LKGGGTVNSVALRNEGIEWWCQEVGPKADSKKVPLVVSILSKDNSAYELVEMTKMVKDFDIVGIEINVSCPNTGTDFISFANSADNIDRMIRGCWAVRDETDHPIILKLSPAHKPKTCEKVTAGVQGGVEALAINSVPWSIAFPDKKSSLAHLGGGGVSGRIAQVHTWRMANDLRNITDIPVIWPGVWDYEDIKILWKIGADAISFSSIFFLGPWKPTIFVRRDVRCRT
jgi:dihydroorotate dehydrogenase